LRLTVEDNPEAVKRYRHIKPASVLRKRPCATVWRDQRHTCTREKGHRGPHVAHSLFRQVVAVWESVGAREVVGEAVGRKSQARTRNDLRGRPVGLRGKSSGSVLKILVGLVRRAISSPDEIAFVLLFAVFVWFAIEVLLILH
jgi:hypothetical protein